MTRRGRPECTEPPSMEERMAKAGYGGWEPGKDYNFPTNPIPVEQQLTVTGKWKQKMPRVNGIAFNAYYDRCNARAGEAWAELKVEYDKEMAEYERKRDIMNRVRKCRNKRKKAEAEAAAAKAAAAEAAPSDHFQAPDPETKMSYLEKQFWKLRIANEEKETKTFGIINGVAGSVGNLAGSVENLKDASIEQTKQMKIQSSRADALEETTAGHGVEISGLKETTAGHGVEISGLKETVQEVMASLKKARPRIDRSSPEGKEKYAEALSKRGLPPSAEEGDGRGLFKTPVAPRAAGLARPVTEDRRQAANKSSDSEYSSNEEAALVPEYNSDDDRKPAAVLKTDEDSDEYNSDDDRMPAAFEETDEDSKVAAAKDDPKEADEDATDVSIDTFYEADNSFGDEDSMNSGEYKDYLEQSGQPSQLTTRKISDYEKKKGLPPTTPFR